MESRFGAWRRACGTGVRTRSEASSSTASRSATPGSPSWTSRAALSRCGTRRPASPSSSTARSSTGSSCAIASRAGTAFRTRSDTEVILAGYLERGIDCVREMNGQFAFALWDPRSGSLWLARDRPGICPLVYTMTPDGLAFASEAKALFAGGHVTPALDPRGLKQSIQLWAPVAPRTAFEGVQALPPATVARFADGRLETWSYWDLDLGDPDPELAGPRAAEALGTLLTDAVRLRLRADVPVAAYLSGGLDSSLICALAQEQLGGTLSTFSVAFDDASFDERRYQEEVAAALRTHHRAVPIADREIGELLPEMVEKGEQLVLRSAPAPFLRLSQLVRDNATKVVLTGEGSDEILLGYDLYRETQVRAFWARRPSSRMRPALLRRLYPYLALGRQGTAMLEQAFRGDLQAEAPAFSHEIRWAASGRVLRFLAPEFAARAADEDPVATVDLRDAPASAARGAPWPARSGWRCRPSCRAISSRRRATAC